MTTLFFFGSSERQLFGAYHPAKGGGRRGAVLCNPWGPEYLRAHRALRFLADLLAEGGLHVLRFDWYGSGDSAGECYEGGEPESWERDLREAVTELKDMAEIKTVSIVGLRMGADVGARVAQMRKDIDGLVLWDPVVDGRQYAESLVQDNPTSLSNAYPGSPEEGELHTCEVSGFPLTEEMRRGIETLVPSGFDSGLPTTLLVSSVEDPDRYSKVRQGLDAGGAEWVEATFDGPEAWVEEGDLGTSAMPVAVVRRITEWLS